LTRGVLVRPEEERTRGLETLRKRRERGDIRRVPKRGRNKPVFAGTLDLRRAKKKKKKR